MFKPTRYALVGLGLTLGLTGIVFLLRSMRPEIQSVGENFPRAKGPANAVIQIIEYSDFQCPACKTAQGVLVGLLSRHQGKLRLAFHHFPLENHQWSGLAHRAAECAAHQNRFWPYHDQLYANQEIWSKAAEAPVEAFLTYAKEIGADLDRFAGCLADPQVDIAIQEDKNAGMGLGVRSTPSFFVNGNLVVGVQGLETEVEKLR